MSRRFRSHPLPLRRRIRLAVELLESRDYLDAGLLSATVPQPDHLVIHYRDSGPTEYVSVAPAPGQSIDDALAAYRADPRVLSAEVDQPLYAAVIPNDPYFGTQFDMNNIGQSGGVFDADIDAPEAWNITTGSTKNIVAVIDTGVDYSHPDLYRNIWINQTEIPAARRANLTDTDGDGLITFWDLNNSVNQGAGKITDLNGDGRIDAPDLLTAYSSGGWADGIDGNGSGANGYIDDVVGWNFVSNNNNPLDDNGHGSHVSGTIGAVGNDGVGVAGINWKVQIMPVKFLSASGSGSTSAAINSVYYAINNGANISNNSWGGGGYSAALETAIGSGISRNHIFVAAAGNSAAGSADYPALYNLNNIIAVAATDRYDNLASYSNYSSTNVELGAPGSSILSTWMNSSYNTISGTSMATPHVAGVAALVRTLRPTWSYSQIISQVVNTGDLISSLSGKTISGRRLNAYNAVAALGSGDTTGPRITSATSNSATNMTSVRVTFSEAINPATFTSSDITFTNPAGGSIGITGISAVGTGNTQFDILFGSQTAAGTYTMGIGPNITDTAGNAMNQNGNGTNGEGSDRFTGTFTISSSSTYTYSSTTPLNIPDLQTVTSTITVGPALTIADLNVQLNINHTYDSDLYIRLVSPGGTSVVLFYRHGGSGDNLTNTIFDDEASIGIASGAAPFSSSYRPYSALSAFDGKNAQGTWQLIISDVAALDSGRLNSWSITIQAASGASSFSEDGGGEGGSTASASAAAGGESAGTGTASSAAVGGTVSTGADGSNFAATISLGGETHHGTVSSVVTATADDGESVVCLNGSVVSRTTENAFATARSHSALSRHLAAGRSLDDLLSEMIGELR